MPVLFVFGRCYRRIRSGPGMASRSMIVAPETKSVASAEPPLIVDTEKGAGDEIEDEIISRKRGHENPWRVLEEVEGIDPTRGEVGHESVDERS